MGLLDYLNEGNNASNLGRALVSAGSAMARANKPTPYGGTNPMDVLSIGAEAGMDQYYKIKELERLKKIKDRERLLKEQQDQWERDFKTKEFDATQDYRDQMANRPYNVGGNLISPTGEMLYKNPSPYGKGPMDVQSFKFWKSLPEDQQQEFLKLKRRDNWEDFGTYKLNPFGVTRNVENFEKQRQIKEGEIEANLQKDTYDFISQYGGVRRHLENTMSNLDDTIKDVMQAEKMVTGKNTSIMGALTSWFPGSDARTLRNKIDTVLNRLGIDRLVSMKESSPSGASGFGALSQQELKVITGYLEQLDQFDDPAELRKTFGELLKKLNSMKDQYVKDRNSQDRKYKRLFKYAKPQAQDMYRIDSLLQEAPPPHEGNLGGGYKGSISFGTVGTSPATTINNKIKSGNSVLHNGKKYSFEEILQLQAEGKITAEEFNSIVDKVASGK